MNARLPTTWVISLTPFGDDESLDEVGLRAHLRRMKAAGIGVYVAGSGSGEAYTLTWGDVLDDRGRARKRLMVRTALSDGEVTTPKSARAREPELFTPVARELVALHLAQGRPTTDALVFPDAAGSHLRRQNWRRRAFKRRSSPRNRVIAERCSCSGRCWPNNHGGPR